MTPCMTYAYQLTSVYHCMCRDKVLALISADGILLLLVFIIDDMLHDFPKGSVILLA